MKEDNRKVIDFNDIDFSKYKKEIEEIQNTMNELKKNKRFMRKFKKFILSEEGKKRRAKDE